MKRIEIEDLLQYRFLSHLETSEDGRNCVFVVSNADVKENSYQSYLYLYRDGKIRQLTSLGKESSYMFNGNDELWIFTSRNKDEAARAEAYKQFTPVYRMDLSGGEAIKSFELPIRVSRVKKINDDLLLISAFTDKLHPDYHSLSEKKRSETDQAYQNDKDYETFNEVPFYFNGMGYTRNMRSSLFLYHMGSGKLQKITEDLFDVGTFDLLDGKIYYAGNSFSAIRSRDDEIRSYDLKTGKTKKVLPARYSIYSLIAFAGKIIVLANRHLKHGLNENAVLFSLDPKERSLKEYCMKDRTYGNSSGSDCRYGHGRNFKVSEDRLYFLTTVGYRSILSCFDTDGKEHLLYEAEGSIDDFDVIGDRIVLNMISASSLQELYLLEEGKVRKISDLNYSVLKNRYVALPEKITVHSGRYDIDGWILRPKDYDPKKKYPAVLDIHGGPKTVYGEIFYHEMQVWAGKGYFVFFCNPFGSDGRGSAFADMRGRYGTTDYKNIMDFTDEVLKRYPCIDPKRVCVTGGSYGGFMTNWIVSHTDRFVAAATQRSISNWISFIGTSDIGLDFTKDQCAADLKDPEKLWKHSPLKYVERVKTPILFIHSDEDYRCPLEQGLQYYSAITDRGIETRMVVFHGENHELSRSGKPLHRIRRLKEITSWFDRHTVK